MKICPQCRKTYDSKIEVCPEDGAPLAESGTVSSDPMIGRVLTDRYRLTHKIGEGGMGSIYKAVHMKMERICAIKLLTNLTGDHAAALARFNREAKMASRIDNPHAVTIYDFGETEDGTLYIAMEFIDGKPLSSLLTQERQLPPERAIHITNQIAQALSAAHALDIVHRDLKPDNVMITRKAGESDYVKVLDFGIAKTMSDDGIDNVTKTGFVLGTPVYMSPEQLSGEKLDARSDIYSLAIIVYEMLSGCLPFEGENTQAIMIKRITTDPVPLRRYLPSISDSIEREVMAALQRRRENRPQSIREFVSKLEAALGSETQAMGSRITNEVAEGSTVEWSSYEGKNLPFDARGQETQADASGSADAGDQTMVTGSLREENFPQGTAPVGKLTDAAFTRADTPDATEKQTDKQMGAQRKEDSFPQAAQHEMTLTDDGQDARLGTNESRVKARTDARLPVESRPSKPAWGLWIGSAAALAIIAFIVYVLIPSSPPGFAIVIEDAPAGSEVFVNNVRQGATSEDGELSITGLGAGDSSIRVTCEGYADFSTLVTGKEGEERRVAALLLPMEIDYKGGMVLIPAGDFIMGSDAHTDFEKPEHTVSVPYAYYIDKYEVTLGEYKQFRTPPSDPLNTDDDGPVLGVTWDEAVAYASFIGKRLPTEEEWEKAASWDPASRQKRMWPWGNESDSSRANIASTDIDRSRKPVPVRQFSSDRSAYGVYGMGGNAWEWVNSVWAPYEGSKAQNPEFGKNYHVVRGGNFMLGINSGRATARDWLPTQFPSGFSTPVGIRCAISADDPKIQSVLRARRK
ncbi:MAG: SUMF1/EgtB/PvdO family nonheme iron enzyme [Blastocatellia bacterium]|nr:SUMF1/EgtB/PvdO family nonheme iron enzyme [Blastocatellia bacterium]